VKKGREEGVAESGKKIGEGAERLIAEREEPIASDWDRGGGEKVLSRGRFGIRHNPAEKGSLGGKGKKTDGSVKQCIPVPVLKKGRGEGSFTVRAEGEEGDFGNWDIN